MKSAPPNEYGAMSVGWRAQMRPDRKAVIGKLTGWFVFLCVREHHCHTGRFSGDDKRAEVFPKAFDFAVFCSLDCSVTKDRARHSVSDATAELTAI
jgi:hypothetical protein